MAELELRPRQSAALEKVREAWRQGATNVLVQAPCGFGKTELATVMLRAAYDNGKRGAFICDRLSLLAQTGERFDKYGLDHGIIQGQNERWKPWHRIQLCSIQTLQRRDQWPLADVLIADEAHVLPQALRHVLARRECKAVGLTDTPFTKGLGKYFDVLVNAATTNELIEEGWLTPYRMYSASTPDMTGVKVVNGEWDEKETERRVLPIVGDCVGEYLRLGEGRKAVVFAVSVTHAEELQRQFMSAGIMMDLYTYQQGDEERAASVAEFRKPDSYIRGLISIEALTRGFDVADVGALILARPLRKSLATHIQMLGRVLRTAEGKTDAIILDHSSNCVRFWSQQQKYMAEGWQELDMGEKKPRGSVRPEREPMTCPGCKHIHMPRGTCPACGHVYARRRNNIVHDAGQLTEIGSSTDAAMQRDLYAQLLWIARDKKYANGWAAWQYRRRVGAWPSRIQPEPQPPSPELLRWTRSQMIRYFKGKEKAKARA